MRRLLRQRTRSGGIGAHRVTETSGTGLLRAQVETAAALSLERALEAGVMNGEAKAVRGGVLGFMPPARGD